MSVYVILYCLFVTLCIGFADGLMRVAADRYNDTRV
jgi:preprotein translocase subunit SecE